MFFHEFSDDQTEVYSDEVWAGVEYTVAAHLIREGLTEEGLRLVRAVRARYDGRKRDPFCEVECGNYYVRSMASYGLLPALSGYGCDLTEGTIWFDPKVNREDFRCFFSNGKEWGIYRQTVRQDGTIDRRTEVLYGSEEGIRLKG